MYDHYYTGSDVNIYLRYPTTDRRVHIDKALGIIYNHSMSSSPVYVLGNVDPAFFTRGNSIIQGNFDLAFKSIKYLQTGLNYLLDKGGLSKEKENLITKITNGKETKQDVDRLAVLQKATITDMTTISISQIFHLFEIIIEFNNTNSNSTGETSAIVLEGVKFTSESMSIYSTEESSLVDRYTFFAKNVREL